VKALAWLLDARFVIPGTGVRFGLDALIGLLPLGGDLVAALPSLYLLYEARRLRLPRHVLLRMTLNIAVDFAAGSVPVAGDVFDLFYKANVKNARLMERALEARAHGRSDKPGQPA